MSAEVLHGDCLLVMPTLPAESVHAIVSDPPYGLGFMGKHWDHGVPGKDFWTEALRVAKPGAYLVAFGGTRTYHRLTVAIEDAGWEIRDCLSWLYGSGFPKSLDVSKAIDKHAGRIGSSVLELKAELRRRFEASGKTGKEVDLACGFRAMNYLTLPAEGKRPDPWVNVLPSAEKWVVMRDVFGCDNALDDLFREAEREVVGTSQNVLRSQRSSSVSYQVNTGSADLTAPATDDAKRWSGWGTALKPAWEPIILARKPFKNTVAANVQEHGTGAINIDGCRIGDSPAGWAASPSSGYSGGLDTREIGGRPTLGRWPANVLLNEVAAGMLDEQSGDAGNHGGAGTFASRSGFGGGIVTKAPSDVGGASRFFYTAKASRSERETGLEGRGVKQSDEGRDPDKPGGNNPRNRDAKAVANHHPTVKPLDLMRWLCRLVTPPQGTILDPFTGSGTTGCAAVAEGFSFIGIEREAEYVEIARAIINASPLNLWGAA